MRFHTASYRLPSSRDCPIRTFPHLFFLMIPRPPSSPLFPYTTLFRSRGGRMLPKSRGGLPPLDCFRAPFRLIARSEEHTSELQSLTNLVCRLLLEKKKKRNNEPS